MATNFTRNLKIIVIGLLCCFSANIHSQSQVGEPSAPSLYVVYHLATLNIWEQVATEQLIALEESKLLDACKRMVITVVGKEIGKVHKLLKNVSFDNRKKIQILHSSFEMNGEFPGIEMVKKIANKDPESKILYLHSKGVRLNGNTERVRSWRLYMEYFVVHHWQDCVDALDDADICGVNWHLVPVPHFSGNFWWARASYLQTVPSLAKPYLFENRMQCEFFISTGLNPRVSVLHNGFDNTYPYDKMYPPEEYEY